MDGWSQRSSRPGRVERAQKLPTVCLRTARTLARLLSTCSFTEEFLFLDYICAFVLQPSSCAVPPTVWPALLSGLLINYTLSFCQMFFTCLCISRRQKQEDCCKHSLRWVSSSRRRCWAEFKAFELKKACLVPTSSRSSLLRPWGSICYVTDTNKYDGKPT